MNQRRGVRWSATKAFLRPILKRPNLTVMAECMVERIAVERGDGGLRAKGVEVRLKDNSTRIVNAERELLLAAGAIGSPQLLQVSGIGGGSLLQTCGVEVLHELPGVGENLQDHLQIRSVFKVHNTITLNRRANSLLGKLAMGLEYLAFKTGPLTMPPSQLGAFARSSPEKPSPNIEWHVQPLSLDKFGDPLHVFDAITPSVCNLQPTSRGQVRIRSNDANTHPAITLNYLSSAQDREVAVAGLRYTRQIMAADALARFQPEELKPGATIISDEDLLQAAGDLGTTIFHPVGTCKMGSDASAVVDDRLRVHGVAGLRIIDASIMPRITSGNTNAPTVMIAEQGARFVIAMANGKAD
jgi:choline dehydrogenase